MASARSIQMIVISSDKHEQHHPKKEFIGGRLTHYAESPDRIHKIIDALSNSNLKIKWMKPMDHGISPIKAVHTDEYISYIKKAYVKWVAEGNAPEGVIPAVYPVGRFFNPNSKAKDIPGTYCFDGSSVIVQGTYDAVYDAAQIALTAADHLLSEKNMLTFGLCRPPGHHAHCNLMGGYCFFNNAAIAAKYLRTKGHQIVILDIDFHHGNGTQDIFYQDRNPMYVSLHGQPEYPYYWGDKSEAGKDIGEGFNVNVPLPLHTKDKEYLAALKNTFKKHIIPYQPSILIVSLGLDTYCKDPIGKFDLTTECYVKIGELIGELGLKTLYLMEGGYAVEDLGKNVLNIFSGHHLALKDQ